ncbi:MAG: 4-(cytidine 5'-diphospho)-2-C-methyl-D-erythritol kinase [Candidatus Azobacteroides sp.]|nr:4-(cytidine 5'-diphospho)-2-C-methyl-D-erythritol kinase [Candidatus Azobacteroides sp.]
MICFPNAKINLGLHVLSKRTDGYHDIETVFYPIHLYDALEIVPASEGKTAFSQTGIQVTGNPENNLVVKAYHLLKKDYDLPEISIYLRKQIPFGAGLGGGSSDAAFMIKLLNDFADLKLSVEQMEKYAGQIGADCPFFIQNKPVFAEGTGNVFSPVAISLQAYHLVVVKPSVSVATHVAYIRVKPRQPVLPLKEVIRLPINEWKNHLVNDFEPGVFAQYPEIGEIKRELYAEGALYASMSGSGSAVFGIFDKPVELEWEGQNVYQV